MIKNVTINSERLAQTFVALVGIDSVSKAEGRLCRELQIRLKALGANTHVDNAGKTIGSDTGNLIARIPGNLPVAPLLLSAHMDTVEPGRNIQPVLKDGVFTSAGNTILGADDKCGLAIILEALTCIQENGIATGPLEIVFSICEELGLQGVKHLDCDQLTASMGYVLDTRNTGVLITRAPAANHIHIEVHGQAAHAGAEPEKGISAIALASKAIAGLDLGRIDAQTTCNIGKIHGGMATNIVPDKVKIEGEVRSHDIDQLNTVTDTIINRFQKIVENYPKRKGNDKPALVTDIQRDFDLLAIDDAHDVVTLAKSAATHIGQTIRCTTSGGGSDANVFAQKGIVAGVLGTGSDKVHTVDERVALADMVSATQLLITIIQMRAEAQEAA